MKEINQSGGNRPIPAAGTLDCTAVESWLAEAAEEHLPPVIAEQVQEHSKNCAECRENLARARRGRDWLLVLKHEKLELPADLVGKILARTSGAEGLEPLPSHPVPVTQGSPFVFGRAGRIDATHSVGAKEKDVVGGAMEGYVPAEYRNGPAAGSPIPAWQRNSLVALRHKVMEPRLALVAAMAFFSISLTLNLAGVHITSVRAADLQPQNLRRAATRRYAAANAHVVRYYENLRIVYEVEARVQQLRRAAETAPPPEETPGKLRKGSSNSSRDPGRREGLQRDGMAGNAQRKAEKNAAPADPLPVRTGPRMDVSLPRWRFLHNRFAANGNALFGRAERRLA